MQTTFDERLQMVLAKFYGLEEYSTGQAIAEIKAAVANQAIPYQCCPVCNGSGQTIADGYTTSVYQTCKVCNGAMIIPMYIKEITEKIK